MNHARKSQCTWFNSNKTIASRLDKFFITKDLGPNIESCKISPCVFSDHDSVSLSLDLAHVLSHSPGIWCLNSTLLEDTEFCRSISCLIRTHLEYKETFLSLHDWWDFLKQSLKLEMIKFSKDKQRRLNSDKVRAVNQLTTAKQTLINGDESAKQTIDRLEHEIQAMNYIQQQSWQVRSRAKWLEEGKKPTKYFFKLHASRTQDFC